MRVRICAPSYCNLLVLVVGMLININTNINIDKSLFNQRYSYGERAMVYNGGSKTQ